MKRFLFSVCALAAVVVGCSKSEVLNRPNAEAPIEFNPYSGRIPVTKGVAADMDTLKTDGFQVYAFLRGADATPSYNGKPFMDKEVKFKDGGWAYSGKAYWPANGVLDFIAYGLNAGAQPVAQNTDYNKIVHKVDTLVANQKDLLVALGQRDLTYENTNGTVNLMFSHLLSRVGFTLITKAGNNVNVRVEKVNLDGKFYAEGEVDLAVFKPTTLTLGDKDSTVNRPYIVPKGEATDTKYRLLRYGATTPETFTGLGLPDATNDKMGEPIYNNDMLYKVENPDDITLIDFVKKTNDEVTDDDTKAAAYNKNNRYMMIIPIEASKHAAKLVVKYSLPGDDATHENTIDLSKVEIKDAKGDVVKTGFDFEAGKSYNFQFKVSTNSIDFSVTVEDWDTSNEAIGSGNEFKLL